MLILVFFVGAACAAIWGAFMLAVLWAEYQVPGAGKFLLRGSPDKLPRRRLRQEETPAARPRGESAIDTAPLAALMRQRIVTPMRWNPAKLKQKVRV